MKRSDFGVAATAGLVVSSSALVGSNRATAATTRVLVASVATPPPNAFTPPAGPVAIFRFDDANSKFRPPAKLNDGNAHDAEFAKLTDSPSASLTVQPYYFKPEKILTGLKKTQSTLRFRFDQGSAFPTTTTAVKPQTTGWSTTFILLNTDPNVQNGGDYLKTPIQLATPDAFQQMPFVDGQIKCDIELKHTLTHIMMLARFRGDFLAYSEGLHHSKKAPLGPVRPNFGIKFSSSRDRAAA